MNMRQLQGLLEKQPQRKRVNKSTRIHDLLYGTLLDHACENALLVQKEYKEYLKPVKTARHIKTLNKNQEVIKEWEKSLELKDIIGAYKEEIIMALRESKAVVIKGGTGAGKTTQIPKILLEITPEDKIIGCTQPRRTAAVSVAERMQKEMNKKEIGYSVRFNAKKGERIKYMTEGVLLREIVQDRELKRYSVIILDEIHERTIESLILLKYLLLLIRTRTDLKLVLMSATLEESVFQEIGPFPVVHIKSTRHSVAIHYLKEPTSDYIKRITEKVLELSNESVGILVFLTGMDDIKIVYNLLLEKIKGMKVVILHAKLPIAEQMAAVGMEGPKCILSTNISETSITIPRIKYVIDCGMYKSMVYDSVRNVKVMRVIPVQKVQAIQRAGRTGRTLNGDCFRMYTKEAFDSLHETGVSKIELEDLEHFIFMCIQLNLPIAPHENVQAAISRMEKLQVIKNFRLTPLGQEVQRLPLSVVHSVFLLEACKNKCGQEAAIILGMLEVLSSQNAKLNELFSEKEIQNMKNSDHLALLHLYNKIKRKNTVGLNLQNVDKIVSQLCNLMNIPIQNMHATDYSDIDRRVLDSLFYSHRYNICIRCGDRYREILTGVECFISLSSIARDSSEPFDYIVYNEIVEIGKPVLSIASKLSSEKFKSLQEFCIA
ncbi:pre-mRNA-splicing factor ATP-dependent RNA helicase DHX16 [Nematocida ausubeli]|nr:pre-mRNA-splicing factor ATP-dependent RNA helicase DHX16 [Nematocida ausubeli]